MAMLECERVPESPPPHWGGWFVAVMKLEETDVLMMVGLDAYMLLRYHVVCIKLCLFLTICGILILLPTYCTVQTSLTHWDRYTILNVVSGAQDTRGRLWLAALFAYVFAAYFCQLLYNEYQIFANQRLNALLANHDNDANASTDNLPQTYYTVMLEKIPIELRSADSLREYFEELFPGEVYSVEVSLDLRELNALVDQRARVRDKLECAIAFHCATGQRMEVQLKTKDINFFRDEAGRQQPSAARSWREFKEMIQQLVLPENFGYEKKDSINHYTVTLEELNEKIEDMQHKSFELAKTINDKKMQLRLRNKHDTRAAMAVDHINKRGTKLYKKFRAVGFTQMLFGSPQSEVVVTKRELKPMRAFSPPPESLVVKNPLLEASAVRRREMKAVPQSPKTPGHCTQNMVPFDDDEDEEEDCTDVNNNSKTRPAPDIHSPMGRAALDYSTLACIDHSTNDDNDDEEERGGGGGDYGNDHMGAVSPDSEEAGYVMTTHSYSPLLSHNVSSSTAQHLSSVKRPEQRGALAPPLPPVDMSHSSDNASGASDNGRDRGDTLNSINLESDGQPNALASLSLTAPPSLSLLHPAPGTVTNPLHLINAFKDRTSNDSLVEMVEEEDEAAQQQANTSTAHNLNTTRQQQHLPNNSEDNNNSNHAHDSADNKFFNGRLSTAAYKLAGAMEDVETLGAGAQVVGWEQARVAFEGALRGFKEAERTFEIVTVGSYYKYSTTAFVTFTTRTAETIAHQMLLSHDVMEINHAPNPHDIIWENVAIPKFQITLRTTITEIGLVIASIFWSSLVTAINGFVKYVHLPESQQNYLSVVIILCFLLILPFIFDSLARYYEGLKLESEIQNSIMRRYFYYQLVNIYVTVGLGGVTNISQQLMLDFHNPQALVNMFGIALPAVSLYFCNMLIVKIFSAIPIEMLRPWQLSTILLLGTCIDRRKCTRRQLRTGAFFAWPMLYGWCYPQLMMVQMITVTYACIAPLIMPFGALFFACSYVMYKYQLLFVYVNKNQSLGYMWYAVFDRSIVALLFASFTWLGFFCVHMIDVSAGPFFFALPLPFGVLYFWHYCDANFKKTSLDMSYSAAKKLDHRIAARKQMNKSIPLDMFRRDLYRQPALTERAQYPEPYRQTDELRITQNSFTRALDSMQALRSSVISPFHSVGSPECSPVHDQQGNDNHHHEEEADEAEDKRRDSALPLPLHQHHISLSHVEEGGADKGGAGDNDLSVGLGLRGGVAASAAAAQRNPFMFRVRSQSISINNVEDDKEESPEVVEEYYRSVVLGQLCTIDVNFERHRRHSEANRAEANKRSDEDSSEKHSDGDHSSHH